MAFLSTAGVFLFGAWSWSLAFGGFRGRLARGRRVAED
ncbi:hypothetical protein SAMN05444374_1021, partial [Rhodococcoides kroppenstedtii]